MNRGAYHSQSVDVALKIGPVMRLEQLGGLKGVWFLSSCVYYASEQTYRPSRRCWPSGRGGGKSDAVITQESG